MSLRVFGWDSDPSADPHSFLYCQSNRRGEKILEEKRGKLITLPDGRRAIKLAPPTEVLLRKSARNCLIPFGRVFNKLLHPPTINYPIPAVADYRLSWRYSFMHGEKPQTAIVPAFA